MIQGVFFTGHPLKSKSTVIHPKLDTPKKLKTEDLH